MCLQMWESAMFKCFERACTNIFEFLEFGTVEIETWKLETFKRLKGNTFDISKMRFFETPTNTSLEIHNLQFLFLENFKT